MKKTLKTLLVAALALSVTACSKEENGGSSSEGLKELHDYQTLANEMETWNVLHSQSAKELQVLTNLHDGLLSNDTEGKLIAGLAETWESNEDSTVWTFHLRKGVQWVDVDGNEKGEITSADFVTGLMYVLGKDNGGANSSMPREMIQGAEEYYTAIQNGEEADFETVGIKAVDEYTVEYTMVAPKPYFPTLATYSPLYPVSQSALDEYGEMFGTDNKTIYYSGPYICTEYVNKSVKTLTPNPKWWNTEATRFEKVTISMVDDSAQAYALFNSGEVDYITLPESAFQEIYKSNGSNENYKYLVECPKTKYAYSLHWNFDKRLDDGSLDTNWNQAVANKDFRLAWYYGIDWTDYLKRINSVNPGKCLNDAYTMSGLVYQEDGTEYSALVQEKLGYASDNTKGDSVHARLDADKAAEAKAKAIETLEAQGVTFPVECTFFYRAGNDVGRETSQVFEQMIEEQLGKDFVDVVLKTYSESNNAEVVKPSKFSVVINGWGADYGDPMNYLGQEIESDNAFYNSQYSNNSAEICEEHGIFTQMVLDADKVTDLDARYEAFAEAEAYFISNALTIPVYYDVHWQLTRINDYSKINAMYGMQNYRYINWETTSDIAYTTEQYAEFAK